MLCSNTNILNNPAVPFLRDAIVCVDGPKSSKQTFSSFLRLQALIHRFSTWFLKMRFYHLFHKRCYLNFLSNVFVFNPILSNVSTPPMQHSRLYNIELILVGFYHPTFSSIHHMSFPT